MPTYNVFVEALLLLATHLALRLSCELILERSLLLGALLLLLRQNLGRIGVEGGFVRRRLAAGQNLVFSLSRHELGHFGGCGVEDCSQRRKVFGGDQTLVGTPQHSRRPARVPRLRGLLTWRPTPRTAKHQRESRLSNSLRALLPILYEDSQSPRSSFPASPAGVQLPLNNKDRIPRTTMAAPTISDDYVVTPAPYPARTNTATLPIKSIETTATIVNFADKILITVTQNGRLAHWVRDMSFFIVTSFSKFF
jgi:hypothetical protein